MMYPFVSNKIEQLEIDPIKKVDGYIWYNNVEKVYKTWVGDDIHIFITNVIFSDNIEEIVNDKLNNKQFSISFDSVYSINVKHNMDSSKFVYSIFDTVEKTQLNVQMEIVNDNEIKVEFIDPVSGILFMNFQ